MAEDECIICLQPPSEGALRCAGGHLQQPVRRRVRTGLLVRAAERRPESLGSPKREGRSLPELPETRVHRPGGAARLVATLSYLGPLALGDPHREDGDLRGAGGFLGRARAAAHGRHRRQAAAGQRRPPREQLKTLLKDAAVQGKWGPIDFRDCDNLSAHHDQVIGKATVETALEAGGEAREVQVKIDNSCPRCGWFSPNLQAGSGTATSTTTSCPAARGRRVGRAESQSGHGEAGGGGGGGAEGRRTR